MSNTSNKFEEMIEGELRVTEASAPHLYFEVDLKVDDQIVTVPVQAVQQGNITRATYGSSGEECSKFLKSIDSSEDPFLPQIFQIFLENKAKLLFATSGDLSDSQVEDIRHILYHFGEPQGFKPGRFTVHLMEAFSCADISNFSKLGESFPYMGKLFKLSKLPGGVESLVKKLNERK